MAPLAILLTQASSEQAVCTDLLIEIRLDPGAILQYQVAVLVFHALAQDAEGSEKPEIFRGEPRMNGTPFQQVVEGFRGDLFGDRSLVQQALQDGVIVDTAFHYLRVHQMHEAVDEHFGGAEQAFFETAGITLSAHHSAEFFLDMQSTQHILVDVVVLVPQQHRVDQRIPQGTDADLEFAAILDQGAGIEPDHVIGVAYRHLRRCEDPVVETRVVQYEVEIIPRHHGIAVHEGEIAIDLGDQSQVVPVAGGRHQVQTDIGIAAEAETFLVLVHCHELGDDVDTHVEQVPCHVGVVRADVVLLRMAAVELLARGKIKLNDTHVGRQPVLLALQVELRVRVVAEDPLS